MLQHADDLSLLQAQIVYKKRLESVMRELTAQESSLLERVDKLKAIMLQEKKDVERLEGRSLAALFYHVTGQMDSILTKERREAYVARVRYDASIRELDAIREDILATQEDLKDLHDCEERYRQKLAEKRLSMEEVQDHDGALLLEKEHLAAYYAQQEQELEEAISAGTSALRTMAAVQQNLHSAKDWSAQEHAFWADHARQEKLDQAQENVELLQVQLQRFNKELSDITIRPDLQPSIDRMLSFAETFFKDLLTDMSIPERITQSCTQADQTREHILGVLRQLQNTMEETRHNQARIRQEMDNIVLNAANE